MSIGATEETSWWRERRGLIVAVAAAVAFLIKLLLAIKTYGTNDVYTYERFGLWARYFGAELYTIAPDLNHPPSMLHVLSGILWLADRTHVPFHFWLRFAGIVADAGTVWLVCRIVGQRLVERPVFIAVLLIALAPINIMVSGFHGNTDPVLIFFVLAAVWLASDRDNPLAAGAAFGLAFCIKIAPVILVPVFFLWLREARKRVAFFAAAAVVVVLSWSPYIFDRPSDVVHQVFGYKSSYGLWGFSWLLRLLARTGSAFRWLNLEYSQIGSPIVLASILILSLWMNSLPKKPSLYAQAGMVYFVFFALTSGFAVQYMTWLTPWLVEAGALPAALFMVTGSFFLLVVYNYWNLGMPWHLAIAYPWYSHQYFQALCWISVLGLAFTAWRRIRDEQAFEFNLNGVPPVFRAGLAIAGTAFFLAWPAVVHMRRDNFGVSPAYAEDVVLYTQADEYHNLATELYRRSRTAEAQEIQRRSDAMEARAQTVFDSLARLQPARYNLTTPENYVDASLDEYNNGDFAKCVQDATESLRFRPGMPAAWNNIALCNAQLGNWDAALAAATELSHIEPEGDGVQDLLDWVVSQRRAFGK